MKTLLTLAAVLAAVAGGERANAAITRHSGSALDALELTVKFLKEPK